MKSPLESKTVVDLVAEGKPFIIATYVTGRVALGRRVDQESGKAEYYGQFVHGLVVDREVVKVTTRMPDDAVKLALAALPKLPDGEADIKADIPPQREALMLGCKAGEPCVVALTTYVWEEGARKKMALRISGRVLPL